VDEDRRWFTGRPTSIDGELCAGAVGGVVARGEQHDGRDVARVCYSIDRQLAMHSVVGDGLEQRRADVAGVD